MQACSSRPRQRRRGITLVEVLVAIFIMGIGLLALLTLFPLGALNMARAVQDDRAGAIAADAATLSDVGKELLARTRQYVVASFIRGSADPKTAAALKNEYEGLNLKAADLECRLQELRTQLPNPDPKVQTLFDQLMAQIRAIQDGFALMAELLELLEQGL
jgi:prepilin-type N-terminal cleavage/methylation domain-containing protein